MDSMGLSFWALSDMVDFTCFEMIEHPDYSDVLSLFLNFSIFFFMPCVCCFVRVIYFLDYATEGIRNGSI
jgi:hypothetical protein